MIRTARRVVLGSFLIAVLGALPLRVGRVLFRRVISSRSHAFIAVAVCLDETSPLEMVPTRVLEDEVNRFLHN